MKNLFLFLTLIALGCGQQKKNSIEMGFVIQGEVTNFRDGTQLYLDDPDTQKRVDSTVISEGAFQFKGSVEGPKRFFLSTKYDPKNADAFKYTSFWVDNAIISFEGDYNDFSFAKVSGLALHDIDKELSEPKKENTQKIDSLSKLRNSDTENNRRLYSEIKKLRRLNDSITMHFIKEKPNNYVSLSSVGYFTDKFSKKELRGIYNALDENLKQTEQGKSLKQYMSIDKILEKGDQFTDVEGKTLSGETKTLASIIKQHKYTILDFWAAGCGPCRLQSKQYREIHKTYKEKGLAIVSFSLDKNKENWEKASKKDSISWVNISDLNGDDGIAPMTYGVRGIPNSFLINNEGKIVSESNYYSPKKPPFKEELEKVFSE